MRAHFFSSAPRGALLLWIWLFSMAGRLRAVCGLQIGDDEDRRGPVLLVLLVCSTLEVQKARSTL